MLSSEHFYIIKYIFFLFHLDILDFHNTFEISDQFVCVCVCVCVCVHAHVCVLMAQSCPTLCDPLDIGFSKQEYWSG